MSQPHRTAKIVFKTWSIPIALLILVILGFGLLINSLGFYQDDWYLVWMGHHFGPQVYISFFEGSRPFLAGIYMLTTQLLGSATLGWQIFALLTRWLAVLTAWWALKLLWPNRVNEVTWIAVLLAIYPGFKQHFLAVIYSNVYIALAAFFTSLAAMLLAIRRPRYRWPLTILGVLTSIFCMVTTEYFFGLELLRPVFLWIILSEQPGNWRPPNLWHRLRQLLIHWAPYLAATLVFLVWRVFFFTSYMYGPKLLDDLSASPFAAGFRLFQTIIQDAFEANIYAWLQTFDFTKVIYPDLRAMAISWAFFALVTALVAFYLLRLKPHAQGDADSQATEPKRFPLQAILLGLTSALVVGWPYWFAGLQVDLVNGFDRFTLAYMFGAAILIVGLLDWLIKNQRARIVIVSLLVGAAVLFQFRNAQTYQYVHSVQASLFRDLVWRAPGLQPGAKVLINDLPVDYTGNASMNAALNWIYAPDQRDTPSEYQLLYLPFKLGAPELPDLSAGPHTANALVAFYTPPGCVQVIDPQVHQVLPRLTESIQAALPISNLDLILKDSQIALENYRKLFGGENIADWCYYFEKADLARQLGDWPEVVRLGDEAARLGLGPNDKFSNELLPFIEGYGRLERWDDAFRLTQAAHQDIPALQEILCQVWQRIAENTPAAVERESTLEKVHGLLSCTSP